MVLTLNTDASFHPTLKYGGWCFYAICNDFKIKRAGMFRGKLKRPEEAEIACILNALTILFSSKISKNTDISWLIINSDCLNGIEALKGNNKHLSRYRCGQLKKYRITYKNLLKKYQKEHIKIEFRHVYAHSGVGDNRSFVNEFCDRWSKKFMWDRVNKSKELDKEFIFKVPKKYII